MRAAAWATNRDIGAAQLSWEHAAKIADALPADGPQRTAMRIAPRTMLCGIAWRIRTNARARFDELRKLCTAAGDKASLAIAMAGLVMDHSYQSRLRDASQLASEAMDLIDSIGDPTLTVGLSIALLYAKGESSEWCEALRWLHRSSSWPMVIPRRAISLSGLRWRSPWPCAARPGVSWAIPDGKTTGSTPGDGP